MTIPATGADINFPTITIVDRVRFPKILFAGITLRRIVIILILCPTILAIQIRADFFTTANAQTICSNIEWLKGVRPILANAYFGIELLIHPIRVATKTNTGTNLAVVIVEIVESMPQVWNLFQLRKLALHQIPIDF